MITEHDKKEVDSIRKYLDKQAMASAAGVDGAMGMDWEKIRWIETLDRVVENLCKAPYSYRFCSAEDVANNYYTAQCNCGWWGSSKLLDGGGAIADTGDYSDCTCPVCGSPDIGEKEEATALGEHA